jgi:hypothetical protein
VKYKFNSENEEKFNSIPFGARLSFSRDYFSGFVGLGYERRFTSKEENVAVIYTGVTFAWPLGTTLRKVFK